MRRTKDAITDLAVSKGYDGGKPKTIAGAVDALAGVAGGGSGGGGGMFVKATTQTGNDDFAIDEGNPTYEEVVEYIETGNYNVKLIVRTNGGSIDHVLDLVRIYLSNGKALILEFGGNGTGTNFSEGIVQFQWSKSDPSKVVRKTKTLS